MAVSSPSRMRSIFSPLAVCRSISRACQFPLNYSVVRKSGRHSRQRGANSAAAAIYRNIRDLIPNDITEMAIATSGSGHRRQCDKPCSSIIWISPLIRR
jgi:hypothetical protein